MGLRREGCHHHRTSKDGHSGILAWQWLGEDVSYPRLNLFVKVSLYMVLT